MDFYFVRGGCPLAPILANELGWGYGVRSDYKEYSEVHMLDSPFGEKENWTQHLQKSIRLRPRFVIVPDYLSPDQRAVVISRYEALSEICPIVGIVPKFKGAIKSLPSSAIICISVPAPNYHSFLPPYRELYGRKVHLLGGSPRKQKALIQIYRGMGVDVVSLDNSYIWLKGAKYRQWFDGKRWLTDKTSTAYQLARLSGVNLTSYLEA